jgi:2-polyprenyl-6-methoxyphenol hydroxylase-like FAD-dependent oxidoreductase
LSRDADVIVIGAGPAGCAAAIRLATAGYNVIALERKEREDGEDITSGEVLVVPTQNECAQIGVKFEGDWVLDRITGFRNVYPDLSWTYHPIPTPASPVQVDRGGFNAALRRRLVEVGGRLVWNSRVTDLEFRDETAIAITADLKRYSARMLIDAGGRYAPSLRALNLKSEDPEFSQIGVAVFFKSFDGTPLNTWDRHLYGVRGAMISGSRIRPGGCIDTSSKRISRRSRATGSARSSFTSQSRASTINGSTSASCESRAWAGNGRWRRSDIASAPSRAIVCCWSEMRQAISRR